MQVVVEAGGDGQPAAFDARAVELGVELLEDEVEEGRGKPPSPLPLSLQGRGGLCECQNSLLLPKETPAPA